MQEGRTTCKELLLLDSSVGIFLMDILLGGGVHHSAQYEQCYHWAAGPVVGKQAI